MTNSVEIDTQRDCYKVTAQEDRMEENMFAIVFAHQFWQAMPY